ncbi:DUF1345 domain-containing protein [Reyranella sp.]|uniref:DUF1345 domain-containing protein n=1 Tax=Reyranella sp. TaxID=1929291 RepID=UPI0037846CB8
MTFRTFKQRTLRFIVGRRRLLVSFGAAIVVLVVLPDSVNMPTRFIYGWDMATFLYVGATMFVVAGSTVSTCRERAALYDEGDWIILLLVIGSAAASFVAIFAELAALAGKRDTLGTSLILTALTVALSWTFTHLIFALHYANVYYKPDDNGPGGLSFPGNRQPDYHDFLYYSFVIGCAAQTADVATTSPVMRRLTLVHGIVAFAFNTAILALAINVGASLLN